MPDVKKNTLTSYFNYRKVNHAYVISLVSFLNLTLPEDMVMIFGHDRSQVVLLGSGASSWRFTHEGDLDHRVAKEVMKCIF